MKKVLILVLALMLMMILISFASCEEDEESSEQASSNEQESSSSTEESSSSSVDEETSSTDDSAEPHICEYGEWQTVTEATCIEKGLKRKTCLCGKHVEEEIPATGIHTYELGKCKHCRIEQASQGLEFDLDWETDTYILTGKGTCSDKTLVIPSTVDGKPVSSIKQYAFENCAITSVIIPDSITEIGYGAFIDCSWLESITIANGVTKIGGSAFKNCYRLKSITIPNSVTEIESDAFLGCSALINITIPNSVTKIGNSAFAKCPKLVEVYNLSTLDVSPYFSDENVIHSSLDEPSILETINDYIFMTYEDKYYLMDYVGDANELTLPDDYEYEIHAYAFYRCFNITQVIIPNKVTSIGSNAFRSCASLTNIIIGINVATIGEEALYDCPIEHATVPSNAYALFIGSRLKTLVINGGPKKSIRFQAFCDCTSLESVTIGDSINVIEKQAFYYLPSLTSVTIGSDKIRIEEWAFKGCPIENATIPTAAISHIPKEKLKTVVINGGTEMLNVFSNSPLLESVTITDGVTEIAVNAFEKCASLTSITLPGSIKSIGSNSFSGCNYLTSVKYLGTIEQWCGISFGDPKANPLYNGATLYLNEAPLTNLVIPNTITEIKDNAFSGCVSITSVTIPNSITSIGIHAFQGCSFLENAHFENTSNWYVKRYLNDTGTNISSNLSNTSTAANYLTSSFRNNYWKRV